MEKDGGLSNIETSKYCTQQSNMDKCVLSEKCSSVVYVMNNFCSSLTHPNVLHSNSRIYREQIALQTSSRRQKIRNVYEICVRIVNNLCCVKFQ